MLLPLLFLLLTVPSDADQFSLIEKYHPMSNGCDLRLINVCGCTKSLAVHRIWSCRNLLNVRTHGEVCDGKWQLNTQRKEHIVHFEKPGCKEGFNLYDMHGSTEDGDGKEKTPGAKCEGIRY